MPLIATPFVGGPQCEELRAFFQPAGQFDGRCTWQFGKGLRGAYLDSFEYLEYMPVSFLWRDGIGQIEAVSNVCARSGLIRIQLLPAVRRAGVMAAMLDHGAAVLGAIAPALPPRTLSYDDLPDGADWLTSRGYARDALRGIHLDHPLGDTLPPPLAMEGYATRVLRRDDPVELAARAEVQTNSFSDDDAFTRAWQIRNLGRSLAFTDADDAIELVTVGPDGALVAFASIVIDRKNRIGELRPLGAVRAHPDRDRCILAITLAALAAARESGCDRLVTKIDIHDSADLSSAARTAEELTARASRLGFSAGARLYEYVRP